MKNMKRVLWISVGVLILSDVLLVLTIYLIYSQCCTAPAVKNVLSRMVKFKGGYVTDPMCIYGVDILGTKNVLLNLDNSRAFARIARYKRPPNYVLPTRLTLETEPETLSYSAKPAKFFEQNQITIAGRPLYYASYLSENPKPPLGVFLGSVDNEKSALPSDDEITTIEIIVTNEPSQQMLCKYYNVLLYQIEDFPQ